MLITARHRPIMTHQRRSPLPWFIVSLSALLVGMSCDAPPEVPDSPPLAIRVSEAQIRRVTHGLDYVGTVHAQNELRVLARIPGTLVELPVPEGELAQKGDLLAKLTAHDLAASYQRTAAELTRAKAEKEHQCNWYAQYRKLGAAGTVSDLVVDRHRQACLTAGSSVSASRSSRRLQGAMLSKTREQAPFSGKVLEWLAEPGQNVQPGQPILLFGKEDLEIRAQVAEGDVQRHVRVGAPVRILVAGESHLLRVERVAPTARGQGRMVEVRVPLPASLRKGLRHGMSVNMAFVVTERDKALAIPAAALTERDGHQGLFLLEDKTVRWVQVRVTAQDGRWAAVEGQLPTRFAVAVTNLEMLEDRAQVYPVPEGKDSP